MSTTPEWSAVLDALDPAERSAVLDRLLADHPQLRSQAETLGRTVLADVDEDAVTDAVVEVYCGIEIGRIGDRMGRRRGRGYVDENEAAWELLEEALEPFLAQVLRRGRAGFMDAAQRYAAAVLTGLDHLRTHAEPDSVFGWGPAEEAAESLGDSVRDAAAQAGAPLPDPSAGEQR